MRPETNQFCEILSGIEQSIHLASEQTAFLRTRMESLLASPKTEPAAIAFVSHALNKAERELTTLIEVAKGLREDFTLHEAA